MRFVKPPETPMITGLVTPSRARGLSAWCIAPKRWSSGVYDARMTTAHTTLPKPQLGDRYQVRGLVRADEATLIYTVWDLAHHQERVAKVLVGNPTEAGFRIAREQLKRQAELRHPHLLRVYDYDLETAAPYLIRERYPRSQRLRNVCHGRRGVDAVISQVVPIAGALSCLHSHGITHKNVNPSNILVDAFGRPKLCNLGIAHEPNFQAPEQGRHPRTISPLADQYAFGATVYHLITGQDPRFLYVARRSGPCWEPIPGWLRPILQQATQRDPQLRFHTVEALVHTLLYAIRRSKHGSAADASAQPSV